MADDDEELALEEQPGDGGKKKKLIVIGAAVVVLLLAIGGGAYWFLMGSADSEEVVAEEGAEAGESGGLFSSGPGKAIYHTLKPKFITTFEANGRQRYVQLEVTLLTRQQQVVSAVINHQPLIRNALVMLIAEQDYLELQTEQGKAALREAAVTAVQDILQREIGMPGVEKVLFTEFVMQ